ncbi:hypothetical protein SY83_13460 [Paenibacillus swuensis]|uniref:ABC transmembrane type-1 domain-containing protein n=1 Tax=Paenibacillus swuensis TaxID=1178515 RepID=A0A172TJ74_9BACL|nr:sugar ABC transporter permease [Paenibacillus swuensis]ANE47101.1 hypothetical protein SY83_13460 [Paenibacillus swuensis]
MRLHYGTKDRVTLLLFLIPALLIIGVSQGYPLVYSLYVSFIDWSLAKSPVPQGSFSFDQYTKLLQDDLFRSSVLRSLQFMAFTTVITLIAGFLMALLLVGGGRWIRLSRTLLMLPMAIAPIAVGTIWRLMLNSQSGLLNAFLGLLNIKGPEWLGNPDAVMWAVIMAGCWAWIPFVMIIYVAAISSIDPSLKESAQIDGAGRIEIVSKIIVPLVMPSTILILMMVVIDTFFVVDFVYSLTNGGPGTSTYMASLYVYFQGFKYFNISYASASSWLLMIISFLYAAILLKWKKHTESRLY